MLVFAASFSHNDDFLQKNLGFLIFVAFFCSICPTLLVGITAKAATTIATTAGATTTGATTQHQQYQQ